MSLLLEPLRVCPVCDRAELVAITLDGRRALHVRRARHPTPEPGGIASPGGGIDTGEPRAA